MEMDVDFSYTQVELEASLRKLKLAARFYDPDSVNLSAFDGTNLSPAVFREMLKRLFNIKLTGCELGALVDYFDKEKIHRVDCNDFIVKVSGDTKLSIYTRRSVQFNST